MAQDQTFRIILIVGSLVFFPIALYHRIRSQATGEPLDRRHEGLLILLTLRPIGIACVVGLIAYMVDPSSMTWSSVHLPVWVRWGGVGLGLLGGSLMIWALHRLGPNLTDTVVTRRAHTLVTSGPYRWVRHPFYTSVALFVVASALTAANWYLLATGSAGVGLLVIRTAREERYLLARFGDAYRDYMRRTGRFLPKRRGGEDGPDRSSRVPSDPESQDGTAG